MAITDPSSFSEYTPKTRFASLQKMDLSFCKWQAGTSPVGDGFLVASDATQEWLLPWWWEHYSRHNDFPVTFVDLGMSKEARAWCKAHGEYAFLGLPDIFVKEKEKVSSDVAAAWEKILGRKFWIRREAWFKKPFACLLSPYARTVFSDLDCEIRSSLGELFSFSKHPSGLAIAREEEAFSNNVCGYNSGIVVYKHGLKLFEKWAEMALSANERFAGDQDVLSHILFEEKIEVCELPRLYNWSRLKEKNAFAKILHWHGDHGKAVIEHELHRKNLSIFS